MTNGPGRNSLPTSNLPANVHSTRPVHPCIALLDSFLYFQPKHRLFRVLREHGRVYRAARLPRDVRRGPMRECFRNAANLALSRHDLTYVEGYAVSGAAGIPLPLLHAWCVTASGRVVDPTWEDSRASRYFGVPIKAGYLRVALLQDGVYGLLDSPRRAAAMCDEGPEVYAP